MQGYLRGELHFFQNTGEVIRQIKIINWMTIALMTPSFATAVSDVIGSQYRLREVISNSNHMAVRVIWDVSSKLTGTLAWVILDKK